MTEKLRKEASLKCLERFIAELLLLTFSTLQIAWAQDFQPQRETGVYQTVREIDAESLPTEKEIEPPEIHPEPLPDNFLTDNPLSSPAPEVEQNKTPVQVQATVSGPEDLTPPVLAENAENKKVPDSLRVETEQHL